MHRVISIETSRRGFADEREFVSKRLCCSFLFSVGFLTILGGFLLGRFSTYREVEIKKAHLEYEKSIIYTRHLTYMDSLNQLSDSLTNLMKSKERKFLQDGIDLKQPLWDNVAECRAQINNDYKGNKTWFQGSDLKQHIEQMLKTYIVLLTNCVNETEKKILL